MLLFILASECIALENLLSVVSLGRVGRMHMLEGILFTPSITNVGDRQEKNNSFSFSFRVRYRKRMGKRERESEGGKENGRRPRRRVTFYCFAFFSPVTHSIDHVQSFHKRNSNKTKTKKKERKR